MKVKLDKVHRRIRYACLMKVKFGINDDVDKTLDPIIDLPKNESYTKLWA